MFHHIRQLSLLAALCMASLPALGGGGSGSIPLKGGGSGSIPLKLAGEALQLHATANQGRQATLLDARINENTLDSVGATLGCRLANATVATEASGSLTLGDETFAIKGACFDTENQLMEVFSQKLAGKDQRARVVGKIPENGIVEIFQGRLTVKDEAENASTRFFMKAERSE